MNPRALVASLLGLALCAGCPAPSEKTLAVVPRPPATSPGATAPTSTAPAPRVTRFAPGGPLPQHVGIPSEPPRFLQRRGSGWVWALESAVVRSKGKSSEQLFAGRDYITSLAVSAKGATAVVAGGKLRVLDTTHVITVPNGTTVTWCGEQLFVAGTALRTLSAGKLVPYANMAGELSPASCRGRRLALRVKGGVRVHHLQSKTWTRVLAAAEPHWPIAFDVAVSEDGRHVAAVEHLEGAHLWTTAGQRLAHWPAIGGQAATVGFSPDGKLLHVGRSILSVPNFQLLGRAQGGGGAWSSDGRLLATATGDGVAVLDVAGVLRTPMPRGMVRSAGSVGLDDSRARLVTLDEESRVLVWSTKTLQVLDAFDTGETQMENEGRLALLPDGTFLVGGDEALVRWTASGERLESRPVPQRAGDLVSVSRDGQRVAVAGSNEAYVIEWATGKRLLTTGSYKNDPDGMDGSVEGVSMHPDGTVVAVGGHAKTHVLDIASGKAVATLKPIDGYGNRVWFSPDGKRLLHTTSKGARLYSWPAMVGVDLPEAAHWAMNAVFSPNGSELVLSEWSGHVVKLNISSIAKVAWSVRAPWHVGAHAVDFDTRRLFTSGPDLAFIVSDLDTGQIIDRRPAGAGRRTTTLAFSPSNRFVAAGDGAGTTHLFDLEAAKRVKTFRRDNVREMDQIRVSDAGDVTGWDGTYLVRLTGSDDTHIVEAPGTCALTTANERAYCADAAGTQFVIADPRSPSFALNKSKLSNAFAGEDAAVSPDGKAWLETEKRWDPARVDLARMIDVHTQSVIGEINTGRHTELTLLGWADGAGWMFDQATHELVRWSPSQRQPTRHAVPDAWFPMAISERHMASAMNRWVVISDVAASTPLHVLPAHLGRIDAMAFSPDGTRLATGDFNGHIYVWDVATGQALMRIVAAVGAWNVWQADGTWHEGGYDQPPPQ